MPFFRVQARDITTTEMYNGINLKTYLLFIISLLLSFNVTADLESYKNACELIGFKKATPDFGECVLELRRKDISINQKATNNSPPAANSPTKKEVVLQGDGSEGDNICQKYGFKVGKSDYQQCRLDLKLAKQQAEAQKRIYDAQMAQYNQQKRIYDAQVAEAEKMRKQKTGRDILNFTLGLASGKTLGQAAPALIGRPMLPRTPRQVIQPVYIQNRNYQCRYDAWRKAYNCR